MKTSLSTTVIAINIKPGDIFEFHPKEHGGSPRYYSVSLTDSWELILENWESRGSKEFFADKRGNQYLFIDFCNFGVRVFYRTEK